MGAMISVRAAQMMLSAQSELENLGANALLPLTHINEDTGLVTPGIIDADPIAISNSFGNSKEFPEEGAVVLFDIGSVSSSLVVWGRKDQFFTRDIPIGGYHFVGRS